MFIRVSIKSTFNTNRDTLLVSIRFRSFLLGFSFMSVILTDNRQKTNNNDRSLGEFAFGVSNNDDLPSTRNFR